ncbi:low temperature requirement protein A [Streptomyces sp. NPDC005374]|uniref:low temperature requirement protein A n=1 Tax=Streptomyces sp. NPDC005374 TaxID=3364713 RepID=UPI00368C1950
MTDEQTPSDSPQARSAEARGSVQGGPALMGRVTPFELFFDLVYVFTLTQITGYMAHEHTGIGVVQGLLLLALVWFSWSAYAWLGNQARSSDRGVLRAGLVVAMAGVFVVALTVPEAWHDGPGRLNGPLVLACAYVFARCVHPIVYAVLADDDRALLRQVAISVPPVLGAGALLITGAVLGGTTQTVLFAVAIVVDWGGVYATSRRGNWRIHSASYFTERHELFIIIALGESLLAMGAAASQQPIDLPLLTAAVLGVAATASLWWLYFDIVTRIVEHRLEETRGAQRLSLAVLAYGYAHFPIVAGIVLTALGMEGVIADAGSTEGLGTFSASALCGGAALYLGGLTLLARATVAVWAPFRLGAMLVLLASLPAAAALPPLAALAGVVVILAAVAAVETWWYSELRRKVRP